MKRRTTLLLTLLAVTVAGTLPVHAAETADMSWTALIDALGTAEDHSRLTSIVTMKLESPDGGKGLEGVSWEILGKALEKTRDLSLMEQIASEKWNRTGYGRLILVAGNEDDDGIRLAYLKRLNAISESEKRPVPGLREMISAVEEWITSKNLVYFHREVATARDYDLKIDASSPLYPMACMYRARMFVWVTTNSGTEETNRQLLTRALGMFRLARAAFPENRIVRMYLGEEYPPEKVYAGGNGAPRWAVYQREGIERLADIIEWWIDHRMQENGEYGGGWGDDCEMWRSWVPVLIAFDDPKITWAQSFFSRRLLDQPHLRGGYMADRMTDVEHSAEDVADVLTPMMHLNPDNPEWRDRALRLASLMKTVWTGTNDRGFLQFKSTYFTVDAVDTSRVKACDTVYHPRAVQPALLYWQRSGDRDLGALFTAWMTTWADAAMSDARGKPAGMLPTAIHWPEGFVGGVGENWWDPQNHPSETRLYSFPSAMSMMCNTLLLSYYMSSNGTFLEPIRSMARIRLDYLNDRPDVPVPGSASWCAERIGFIADTAAKYRYLTGSSEFDSLLLREGRPYVLYRMRGDEAALENGLRRAAEALRINFPGFTSEVRYTDRVVRFPRIFAVVPDGPSFPVPDLNLLYNSATGDYGDVGYFPVNAVRWLTPPRDIAALVSDNGSDRFTAQLYHFGRENRRMGAELYLLDPGTYVFTLQDAAGGTQVEGGVFTVTGHRTRISFVLPPGSVCRLNVRKQK